MKSPTAFLSHSSKDAATAERLALDLRANGVDVWYSHWEIRPGDSLRRKIDEGIDGASHFLVLLTPASLNSEWVQTELDAGMVNRIARKCRLVPVIAGISGDQVPATLRGILWVTLDAYDSGLRRLIEVCHDVSTKPPLGQVPAWARERPLDGADLSPDAQRIASWMNEHSEVGVQYDYFERDAILADLGLTPEQAALAASELEDSFLVKRLVDSGSGPAGFSQLQPRPALFRLTDPPLRGWDPSEDAVILAAAMVNQGSDGVSLADVDARLGWGPRRLNPAADYLDEGPRSGFEDDGIAPLFVLVRLRHTSDSPIRSAARIGVESGGSQAKRGAAARYAPSRISR